MKHRKLTATIAGILLATTALAGTAVIAASDAKAPAAQAAADGVLFPLRVSEDAATALDGVTAARMALMQWSGDHAKDVLGQVRDLIGKAADGVSAADLAKADAKGGAFGDSLYYPVAYRSSTFETWDGAPPSQQAIASAPADDGSDQVSPAAMTEKVRMAVTVAFLPRDETLKAIDEAISQIDQGDYAAADVALDTIGNSIHFSTMTQEAASG